MNPDSLKSAPILHVKPYGNFALELLQWASDLAAGDDMGESLVLYRIEDRAKGISGIGVGYNSRKAGIPVIVWPWDGGGPDAVFMSTNPLVVDIEHLHWQTQLAPETIVGVPVELFSALDDEQLEGVSYNIEQGEVALNWYVGTDKHGKIREDKIE